MQSRSIHTVRDDQYQHSWNNEIAPVLHVDAGETIIVHTRDAGNDQIQPGASVDAVLNLDFARVNPINGPIAVNGAAPGDILQVEILDIVPRAWGWTAIIPGFGLLRDEYPDPFVHIWSLDLEQKRAEFRPGISVALDPFIGVIGVAPPETGEHSTVPPRNVGGNMDIRFMRAGTTLYLPVAVEGALFSLGDAHAAQGDGEVCGTAIETAATVTVRLSLVRTHSLRFPAFDISGSLVRTSTERGYYATTGIGPDLMEASKEAVRGMIQHLERSRGLRAPEAYALCSVAADLKISEIVDAPNWVVSCVLPNSLFT